MKVLFVCTGNTCRSPMAQALFNEKVKKSNPDITAESAGLYPVTGSDITKNAAAVLSEMGIDFSHKAKSVTEKMLMESDFVFGLTESHAKALIDAYPKSAFKIYTFPTDISDPFGKDIETYRACAAEIGKGIEILLPFILKHAVDQDEQKY